MPPFDDGRVINYMRTGSFPSFARMLADAKALANAPKPATDSGTEAVLHLRNVCLATEIYDYCGDYEQAKRLIAPYGTRARADFHFHDERRSSRHVGNRATLSLLRQKLWALLHYGNSLYRAEKTREAGELFNECENILDAILPLGNEIQPEPSYGLRSRIGYCQGIVRLQQGAVDDARECFSRSIDFQYKRYQEKKKKYRNSPADTEREFRHSLYMTAKIFGLGLGWCSIRGGELLRAKTTLSCARTILDLTCDNVHKAFLDLRYAETLRAQSSRADCGPLAEAIVLLRPLTSADGVFSRHDRHRVRAQYELALALLDQDKEDGEADSLIAEMSKLTSGTPWRRNVGLVICRRHLLRGQFSDALAVAKEIRAGDAADQIAARARLEAAQAGIALENYNTALDDLEVARTQTTRNPLLSAVCFLLTARCCARLGHIGNAAVAFENWRNIQPRIEHGFVRDLAEEVHTEVSGKSHYFELSPEDAFRRSMSELEHDMQRWVIRRYMERHGDQWGHAMAATLGNKASAWYKLGKKLGVKNPRARTKT